MGFLERVGAQLPIIQAPMAGGPDTPELAGAVSEAGGLGSLGCAYLTPRQIAERVSAVRAKTSRPFAVNLFVRDSETADPVAAARVQPILDAFRAELGLEALPATVRAEPHYREQVDAVMHARPAVFSFTFGIPHETDLRRFREAGIALVGTATSLVEVDALMAAGVDAVCVQGSEAGGHRGTFQGPVDDALVGTLALVRQSVVRTRTPIIAAGGIMDGAGIRAALELGAIAVQLGTAFLLCPEAGTSPAHRAALRSEAGQYTIVTRAFSGRAARGIRNRFTGAFEGIEPAPFPQQQSLTASIRAAAGKLGRTDLAQMWTGQGAALIRELPAGEMVRVLAAEAAHETGSRE